MLVATCRPGGFGDCANGLQSEDKNLPQQKLARTAYQNYERARPQSPTIIGVVNNGHIEGDVNALCTKVR
jgi:hypothetical protein